uniref:hypothetical protein n=1 Tax=uncultured Subdoligranulum sp. TaxID=512298 RepID=UPI0025F0C369
CRDLTIPYEGSVLLLFYLLLLALLFNMYCSSTLLGRLLTVPILLFGAADAILWVTTHYFITRKLNLA